MTTRLVSFVTLLAAPAALFLAGCSGGEVQAGPRAGDAATPPASSASDAGGDAAEASAPDAGALVCPPAAVAPEPEVEATLDAKRSLPFDPDACTEAELVALTPCLERGPENCAAPTGIPARCTTCVYGEERPGRLGAISRFSPLNGPANPNVFGCAENLAPGAGVAIEREFHCVAGSCACPAGTSTQDGNACLRAAEKAACAPLVAETKRLFTPEMAVCSSGAPSGGVTLARRWCAPAR